MARAESRLRVGVDAVGVQRVAKLVADHPDGVRDVFTARELEYCRSKRRRADEHLAARFSAKEAVLKAFGTGLGRRMRWCEVEVVNDPGGRPRVELSGEVAAFAKRHGLRELDISLTHTEGLAIAQAVSTWTGAPRDGTACASI